MANSAACPDYSCHTVTSLPVSQLGCAAMSCLCRAVLAACKVFVQGPAPMSAREKYKQHSCLLLCQGIGSRPHNVFPCCPAPRICRHPTRAAGFVHRGISGMSFSAPGSDTPQQCQARACHGDPRHQNQDTAGRTKLLYRGQLCPACRRAGPDH